MWEDELLNQLKVRDEIEKQHLPYLNAFNELVERVTNTERLLRQTSSTSSSAATTVVPSSVGVGELVDENIILKSLNIKLQDQSNSLGIENQSLKSKIKILEQTESKTIKNIEFLKQKIENAKLEVQEKNKSIEIINDEILSYQIQNNVLQNSVNQLTQENDGLIRRWMEKVKLDAETINEANELIENTKNKK